MLIFSFCVMATGFVLRARFIDLRAGWQIKYLHSIATLKEAGMPIYEYICLKCNERFSLLQTMRNAEKDTICPKCSSKDVKKIISSFCCSSGSGEGVPSAMPSHGFSGGG